MAMPDFVGVVYRYSRSRFPLVHAPSRLPPPTPQPFPLCHTHPAYLAISYSRDVLWDNSLIPVNCPRCLIHAQRHRTS